MSRPISGTEHFRKKDDRFISVSRELRASDGWAILSATQRWILVDWIEAYEHAIHFGTRNITHVGFSYTFGVCGEQCTRRTFHRAKTAIEACRFFTAPPDLQVPHAARRYLPGDWRAWRMSVEQRDVLRARESRRAAEGKRRKREMVDRMARRGG